LTCQDQISDSHHFDLAMLSEVGFKIQSFSSRNTVFTPFPSKSLCEMVN
jgi:hypothetical protein